MAAKKGGKGIPAAAVEAIKARAAASRAIAKVWSASTQTVLVRPSDWNPLSL